MKYWTRAGSVQIGPNKYPFGSLDFEFEVPFFNDETLATANLLIRNLSPKTRAIAEKKGMVVIINAGYEEDMGTIFVGEIANGKSEKRGLDWETKILATEAMAIWLSKTLNKTYAPGTLPSTIIADILNIFGLEVSKMELKFDKPYARGRVCRGPIRKILTEIITSDCKSELQIRNSQIFIKNPDVKPPYAVLLTPETGLLDTKKNQSSVDVTEAQETQLTEEEKKEKDEKKLERTCLLNYRLGPGDTVRILSDELKGDFHIKAGIHNGTREGAWTTKMELTAI